MITDNKILRLVASVPKLPASVVYMVVDFCLATVALAYALVFGPIGIMIGALFSIRPRFYLRVLLPLRLYTMYVKALMDWRLCNFASAISLIERVTSGVEEVIGPKNKQLAAQIGVLRDLYITLTRMYMHCGRVEEAMLVIVRATKVLPIKSLPGLDQIDVSTAQLIRTAINASRLVDNGGWATFTVKTGVPDKKVSKKPETEHKKPAKVIPFPGYNNLLR